MASSLVQFERKGESAAPKWPAGPDAHASLHINDPSHYLGQQSDNESILPTKTKGADRSLAPGSTTPKALESSPPSSPILTTTATARQRWNNPRKNILRLCAACLIYFANGFNDSAPGALLPYIQDYYHVSYAVESTIFIANAAGFILAAFFVHAMDQKLGRARTLMFCEACVVAGYAMMVAPPPFGLFAFGFFVTGFGMAVGLALNNVFAAGTEPGGVVLGFVHGSYGIGGLIAPIVATTAVSHDILFSYVYFIPMGIRVLNFVLAGYGFWDFERTEAAQEIPLVVAGTQTPAQAQAQMHTDKTKSKQFLDAVKTRTTSIGALFIFAYQGAEVAISGWVIDFLISYRNGDPAQVGYVTSGFWGGITLSRFVLSPLALRWSEKYSVLVLIGLCVVFQLLLWLVPNVIANSVATAILGLLLGPVYPIATSVFAKLLDRRLQNTSLASISSAGSSGGALAPFMTGLIAQSAGTWVLSPICIGLYSAMTVCWLGLVYKYDQKRKV